MFKLDAGNVLLKPSHRRQLMTWLKRALRLSKRLNNFVLAITMQRSGRQVEIRADVTNRGQTVAFRARQHDWQDAARQIIRSLTAHLHDQRVRGLSA
ncbi:MAG: hypothetical protein M3O30_01185 [Planctomycetota bacterium]|nr:hypothetical protein [Planctomycetota bacterium]